MKKRNLLRYMAGTLILVTIAWAILTFYVEQKGPSRIWNPETTGSINAIVIFDPDPFYNLDEQVCLSFAKGLSASGIAATVATVAGAETLDMNNYDIIVYCANTYNWRPDWAITDYIRNHEGKSREVVAITLGAGSTKTSKTKLDQIITSSGAKLINSYSLWLLRPNDERKMKRPNVAIAVEMAHVWGKQIAESVKRK